MTSARGSPTRSRGAFGILSARVDALAPSAGAAPDRPAAYLLLLPSADGYRLVARDGEPPAPGTAVEHEGARYRVLAAAHPPLPGDRRPSLLALPE